MSICHGDPPSSSVHIQPQQLKDQLTSQPISSPICIHLPPLPPLTPLPHPQTLHVHNPYNLSSQMHSMIYQSFLDQP